MTRHRVLLISASVGAGHDRPARALAARFAALGHTAQVVDLVDVAPFGRSLRRMFRLLLTYDPAMWGRLYSSLGQTADLPAAIDGIRRAAGRRIARIIDDDRIDLVVSTYPLGGRVLATARMHTARAVPLATYITDPAVHGSWLDAATDLYLTTWSFAGRGLRRLTSTPVAVVAAATAEQFRDTAPSRPSRAARRRDKPWALVCSGSWGVGDVLGTARDLMADGRFQPVVVCGRNAALQARVGALPGVVALGWVEDMAALMRECAVAVLNSGGLTLAEAVTVGLPVIHHRPLPGQGTLNAAACRAGAGLPVSHTAAELSWALDHAGRASGMLGTLDPVATTLSTLCPLSTLCTLSTLSGLPALPQPAGHLVAKAIA